MWKSGCQELEWCVWCVRVCTCVCDFKETAQGNFFGNVTVGILIVVVVTGICTCVATHRTVHQNGKANFSVF